MSLKDDLIARMPPRLLRALRGAKHRGAVFAKHARWGFPDLRRRVTDPIDRWRQSRNPVPFPSDKYRDMWLGEDAEARPITAGEPVPRRIFTVWAGDNPMSERRLAGIESIKAMNPSLEVVLVTPENLADWLVPDHPLPDAYEHLSYVHRSDYLHCYLLHHHGGGYVGIKTLRYDWSPCFDALQASDKWLLGYTELTKFNAPLVGGELQRDLRRVWTQLLGFGGMIARPRTPLTTEWYNRLRTVVDAQSDELARHPGGIWGTDEGYPFDWTEVLAQIASPLMWKYQPHIIHDDRVRPILKNYR